MDELLNIGIKLTGLMNFQELKVDEDKMPNANG